MNAIQALIWLRYSSVNETYSKEKMRAKHNEQERNDELERNRLHFPNGEFIELTK